MKTTIILTSVLIIATGCGKLEEMGKNTETANLNSTRIKELNEAVIPVSLQGATSATRRDTFDKIVQAEDLPAKITNAAMYFNGMEFQTWLGHKLDPRSRDGLITQGLRELFLRVSGIAPAVRDMERSLSPSSGGNERQVLFAVAATLHYVNVQQTMLTGTEDSIYDFIKEAILLNASLRCTSCGTFRVKAYHLEVLKNFNLAVYLLQLRLNLAVSASLNKVSDISKFSRLSNAGRAYGHEIPLLGRFFEWTPDTHLRTTYELAEAIDQLEGALEVEQFLITAGITPRMDGRLRQLVEGMKRPGDLDPDRAETEFQRDLIAYHNELKNRYVDTLKELMVR